MRATMLERKNNPVSGRALPATRREDVPSGAVLGRIGRLEVRLARDGADAHLRALARIEALVEQHAPDLILYQAGADSHEADPKNLSGFSSAALAERDLVVFRLARRLRAQRRSP